MTNPRLEELRARFQENPRRYFAPYANELRKAGDPAQAITVCRTHLASQPGHVSGHIVLGQALYEAGEANEARAVFTAALELDPENLIALRSLGEIAQVNGDFGAARQWYQRLLDADPRNSEVAQLLRDIPAEATAKPIAAAERESREEPTPFTIREEVAAAEAAPAPASEFAPPPAPKVHTGFTGQGPAYKSAEDEREEAVARQADEAPVAETEDAFIDLQPAAHDYGSAAPTDVGESLPSSAESEPMEFVDVGQETGEFAAEATQEMMPDESFDFIEASAAELVPDSGEPAYDFTLEANDEQEKAAPETSAELSSDFETVETYTRPEAGHEIPSLEIEDFAADALSPTSSTESAPDDESAEPPRAVFAERGFDGSVDDMGWMTTPSQAFSDLEAAPEDWLEETRDEASAAEAGETTPSAEGTEPDHATDSWFDEVQGSHSIESADVSSDELWLPPELPQVTNAAANAHLPQESEADAEEPSDVPAWSASAEDEAALEAAPNVTESGWSQPSMSQAEDTAFSEVSEFDGYGAAQAPDVPDEVGEPIEAQSGQEPYAAYASFAVDSSGVAGEVPSAEITSESAAEEEPAAMAEHAESDLEELPEIVSASESSAATSGGGIGQTPTDAVLPPAPAPFLTETLAELYLQQGFRDEALSIYQQLLDRNPSDEALKSRIAALELAVTPSPAPVPAEMRAASQSVRTFFSRLARRPATAQQSVDRPQSGGGGEGGGSESRSDVPFSVAASALANLFSASKPPQADEGAASMLAGAFTDPAGRPSRAAERELSLDHLFRDVAPGGPTAGGVTLDEFYSTPNSGAGSSTESGPEAGAEDPSGTDIRQFTAWLEGLRKK